MIVREGREGGMLCGEGREESGQEKVFSAKREQMNVFKDILFVHSSWYSAVNVNKNITMARVRETGGHLQNPQNSSSR